MTDKKKFKARVRHRMERTGESYATARAHLSEPYPQKILDEIMALAGDHVPTDADWLAQFDWVDRNPDARPLRDFDWVHGIGYVMLDADGNPTKVSPFVKLKADNPDFYSLVSGYFPIGRLPSPLALAQQEEIRKTWVSALFPDGFEDSKGVGSPCTEHRYTDADEFFLAIEDAKAADHETCSYDDPRSRTIGFIDVTACAYHCIGLSYLKAGITDANREFFLGADGRTAYFGHGGDGGPDYYAYRPKVDQDLDLSMGELIWDLFSKKMQDKEIGELMVSLWMESIPEEEKLRGDLAGELECLDDVLSQ